MLKICKTKIFYVLMRFYSILPAIGTETYQVPVPSAAQKKKEKKKTIKEKQPKKQAEAEKIKKKKKKSTKSRQNLSFWCYVFCFVSYLSQLFRYTSIPNSVLLILNCSIQCQIISFHWWFTKLRRMQDDTVMKHLWLQTLWSSDKYCKKLMHHP